MAKKKSQKKQRKKCTGQTVAGKRCGAYALKGTTRCAAHPLDPASTRFGSPEQASEAGKLGGRPRNPRPTEMLAKVFAENLIHIYRAHFEALGLSLEEDGQGGFKVSVMAGGGAKLFTHFEGETTVSDYEDLGAMIEAAEKLSNRIEGRPMQRAEVSGPDGEPLRIEEELRADPETRKALHDLVQRVGAARSS